MAYDPPPVRRVAPAGDPWTFHTKMKGRRTADPGTHTPCIGHHLTLEAIYVDSEVGLRRHVGTSRTEAGTLGLADARCGDAVKRLED